MSRNKIILDVILNTRRNKKFWVGLVLLLALGTALGLLGLVGSLSSEPPLPDPNGYDLILEAASQMSPQGWWEASTMERGELETFVRDGRPVLELARKGLALPARRPLRDSLPVDENMKHHWAANLGFRFVGESRLRSLQGDTEGAVRALLDLARLGGMMACGGFKRDLRASVATVNSSANLLNELSAKMPAEECRAAAKVLAEAVRDLPTLAEAGARERAFQSRYYNMKTCIRLRLTDGWLLLRHGRSDEAARLEQQRRAVLEIAAKLAAHADTLDQGRGNR